MREVASGTEAAVEAGFYQPDGGPPVPIGEAVAEACAGTRMYGPGPVPGVEPPRAGGTADRSVAVTGESSLEAARRLVDGGEESVAVLDFASARNPGGGYLNGAQAQEEALCRASALYTCLRRVPEFYAAHRADPSPFYSDRVLHCPGVPVFRDDGGGWLPRPYRVAFLTAAAPNAGVIARRSPDRVAQVPKALRRRAERVLEVAVAGEHRALVLGAWGCGVFRNRPGEVADAFAALLRDGGRFAGAFHRVVFAVLDRREPSPLRAEFADALGAAGILTAGRG